jgi:hypothetical protein
MKKPEATEFQKMSLELRNLVGGGRFKEINDFLLKRGFEDVSFNFTTNGTSEKLKEGQDTFASISIYASGVIKF